MSAQPSDDFNVHAMRDYLRDTVRGLGELDGRLHELLDGYQEKLFAIVIAEDPEVQADAELFRAGKIDLKDTLDSKAFLREVREKTLVDA